MEDTALMIEEAITETGPERGQIFYIDFTVQQNNYIRYTSPLGWLCVAFAGKEQGGGTNGKEWLWVIPRSDVEEWRTILSCAERLVKNALSRGVPIQHVGRK